MLNEQCLVIYDAARKPSLLDEGWGFGAFSMWLRGRTTGMLGALSWDEAIYWLESRSAIYGRIKEVQFWGHGYPGEAFINGTLITDVAESHDLSKIMKPDGLFWFRTCSSFNGTDGKFFAMAMARHLKCRVAGHTHNIGLVHSGLHSLEPEAIPSWSDGEGTNKDKTLMWSGFTKPNSIMFWRNTIPEKW